MGKGKKKGGNADNQPSQKSSQQKQQNENQATQLEEENPMVEKNQPIAKENESSTSIQSDKDKRNENDWKCNCGYVNFAKKKKCKICSEPKPQPQEKAIEQIPSTSANVKNVSQQPGSSTQQQSSFQTSEQPKSQQQPVSSSKPMPDIKNLQVSRGSNIIESSPDGRVYEGTEGRKCMVEVNYATIGFENLPKYCYHYDVTFVPDIPKKMLPAALQEFMRIFFNGHVYGFDDRKNMFTAQKLNIEKDGMHCAKITANFQDRSKEFEITVKLVATIDMHVLLNYNDPIYQNDEKPAQAIQALDVILKSVFRRNIDSNDNNIDKAIRAGRAVFFVPKNKIDLGDGMELWLGLFQSVILGRAKLYLNIDVLHKAFPSSIPLLEYLSIFDKNFKLHQNASLNDLQKKKLKAHLAMLTIGYRTNEAEPIKNYSFNDLHLEAYNARFEHNNQKMTVLEYFEKIKGIKLEYPKLPVLWVGSRQRKTYLPMELCMIPAGQATNKKCTTRCVQELIKESATTTNRRKEKIRELLNKISYEMDPTLIGFGIKINTNFEKVVARVINPPQLKYSDGLVKVSKGKWNSGNFLETDRNKIKWGILNFDSYIKIQPLIDFKAMVIKIAKGKDIDLEDVKASEIKTFDFRNNLLEKMFSDMKNAGCKFVFVVLKDDNSYNMTKQTTESNAKCIGMLTQCIKGKNLSSKIINPIINNIFLKLNPKLNGKNNEIEEPSFKSINAANSSVMFIGADVTHPPPDQKNTSSVVGVVSSYDQTGFQYYPSWRLQQKEMILDLENILVEHLKFYHKQNNQYPGKILYYRDGVSDGEFKQVLEIEMVAIRKALQRIFGLEPPPPVTFIVVQKRHHTRFFPTAQQFSDGPNNNVLPGTVVDTEIVHPFQYQFFMVSHAAMKGVAKPTKYCILVNECNISPNDLQAITNDLCHFYTRCTRAVSYPAPTYFAHLLAARGKVYIANQKLDVDNLKREYERRRNDQAFVENHPMFFV